MPINQTSALDPAPYQYHLRSPIHTRYDVSPVFNIPHSRLAKTRENR